jgi:acetylornithine/succinyldiaminopimelate/putrescine aminotransferase
MGAFIASRNVMSCLAENPVLGHITTFGGHPVCCAAAKASLEVLSAIGGDEIERKANLFRSLLVHPAIKSITGKGLMMGLTFSSEQVAKDVIQACIQNGVLTDWFLFAPHKLRLAPPLVINDNEIKIACDRIIKSIDQVVN